MASKYIFKAIGLALSATLLVSCLGVGTHIDTDPSRDAQIHFFSMESQADTENVLRDTRFTIDQVNGRIFNREHLPYRFSVDSVAITVSGGSSAIFFGALSEVRVHLVEPDTSFTIIRTDSIPLSRLRRIETQAADRENRRMYDFQLNIFQQDPFVISWVNTHNNYIASPFEMQKTIALGNSFFTYYIAGGVIGAMEVAVQDMETAVNSDVSVIWTSVPLAGLPTTAQLSSLLSVGTTAFILDDANNVFETTDGVNWAQVATDVVAIYGVLPSSGGGDILLAVDDGGVLRFAKTNDFSSIRLYDPLPTNSAGANIMPIVDFSAVEIDNPAIYAAKFIILAGGKTAVTGGLENNDIWLIEYANGRIRVLRQAMGLESQRGSRLFFYNNRLYMMIMTPLGENRLMYSANSGLSWLVAGEGQSFPDDFTHRTHASVITDDDFIWIFGGQTHFGQFSDAWRGRLNLLDEVL